MENWISEVSKESKGDIFEHLKKVQTENIHFVEEADLLDFIGLNQTCKYVPILIVM